MKLEELRAMLDTRDPNVADAFHAVGPLLLDIAKAAQDFYRVTMFIPETHDCISRAQLDAAFAKLENWK